MHQPLVCLLAALLLPMGLCAADAPSAKTPPRIIIKVDDFGVGKSKTVTAQWQRFADFIKERKIKANIGFICNSLEPDRPEFFRWVKDLQGTGLVEFWLHAYEHKDWIGPDGVRTMNSRAVPTRRRYSGSLSARNSPGTGWGSFSIRSARLAPVRRDRAWTKKPTRRLKRSRT